MIGRVPWGPHDRDRELAELGMRLATGNLAAARINAWRRERDLQPEVHEQALRAVAEGRALPASDMPWLGAYHAPPATLAEAFERYLVKAARRLVEDLYRDLEDRSADDLANMTSKLMAASSWCTAKLMHDLPASFADVLIEKRHHDVAADVDAMTTGSGPIIAASDTDILASAAAYALTDSALCLRVLRDVRNPKLLTGVIAAHEYWQTFFVDPQNVTSVWPVMVCAHLAEAARWHLQILEAHPNEKAENYTAHLILTTGGDFFG